MAKKDKLKVPKRIAGVKVPKALRKGLTSSLLDNPRTREILADALLAAAGAAAAVLAKNRPTSQQVADAGETVAKAGAGAAAATGEVVRDAAEAVTEAATGAARQILPSSLTGEGAQKEGKRENYAHLAADGQKGKKDKQRSKTSKH